MQWTQTRLLSLMISCTHGQGEPGDVICNKEVEKPELEVHSAGADGGARAASRAPRRYDLHLLQGWLDLLAPDTAPSSWPGTSSLRIRCRRLRAQGGLLPFQFTGCSSVLLEISNIE